MKVSIVIGSSARSSGEFFEEALSRVVALIQLPDRPLETSALFSLSYNATTRNPSGGRYTLGLTFGETAKDEPELELWLYRAEVRWCAAHSASDPGDFADPITGLDSCLSLQELFPRALHWMLHQSARQIGYRIPPLPLLSASIVNASPETLYNHGPYCDQDVCRGSDLAAK